MDVVRKKQKKPISKYAIWGGAALMAVAVVVTMASQVSSTSFSTSGQNLSIGTVASGNFEVTVRGNGVLMPKDIRWIAANVTGRVEQIHLKPGAIVKQGDLIMTLSNPEVLQRAEEIRWELEAEEAQLQALEVSLASQVLDLQAQVLNAEMNYESAKIKLDAEKILLDEGNATVSKIDYQRSQLATNQYYARWQIEKQRLEKLQENKVAQTNAAQAMLNRLRKTLARAEHQVASLQVESPMEGVLQELPFEAGQQIALGNSMAKLAAQDNLIAELAIPERKIKDVHIGQEVIIDTRISKAKGRVIRVEPAVNNGTVQVDVEFIDGIPPEARPDLTVDGFVKTASMQKTLYVRRPAYAQSNSQTSVFKLDDNGRYAEKVQVEFGVGSSSEIQVVAGLTPGDQIILSDYSAFEHLDRFEIN